jgi:hypothetical protein
MSDDDPESFETTSDEKQINKRTLQVAGAIIALWAFTLVAFNIPSNWQFIPVGDRGSFGDMFGGLNALFSGFAFVGIIYTILLQRIELKLQRKELELTRNVLEQQRREMSVQSDTLRLQSFENTFFSMLKSHNDLLNSIDLTLTQKTYVGRDAIAFYLGNPNTVLHLKSEFQIKKINDDSTKEEISEAYETWFQRVDKELAHYFRSLYNLIKFTHDSKLSDKIRYMQIIRAQLSNQELLLLFYNCLSSHGDNKFKPLIEEYAFLKHMVDSDLVSSRHKRFYETKAFQNN